MNCPSIKPNFVGIGGQKCASTWFSECLRSHPEVFVSSPKELRYFTENKSRGFEWYLKFFEQAATQKLRGEFSSNYIYFPESAEEIRRALGDIKIIAVVREPVERALSHIKHLIRDGELQEISGEISRRQLEDILREHPEVYLNSCYHAGLQKYYDVFGSPSLFVVNQSLCRENGSHVLNALWSFLGVASDNNIAEVDQVVSAGIVPRSLWLEKLRKNAYTMAKTRAPHTLNWVKKSGLSAAYRKVNAGRAIVFSKEAAELLGDICSEDWCATQRKLSISS